MVHVLAWPKNRNRRDNPYTALLYENMEAVGARADEFDVPRALWGSFDVLHVHWPEGILKRGRAPRQIAAATAQALLLIYVRRLRKRPVIWTIHNLSPHERRSAIALRLVRWGLARTVSGVILLSHASRREAIAQFPWTRSKPALVSRLGRYAGAYMPVRSRDETRRELKLSPTTSLIAFIGRMEPYKGAHHFLAAIRELNVGDRTFLIAGAIPDDSYGAELRRSIQVSEAIAEIGWLENARIAELMSAADLLVYPFEEILNSSSILLPLEFNTPVLAPALGSIPEVAADVGSGWVSTYDGTLSAEDVRKAIARRRPSNPPNLDAFSWQRISADTADFFRSFSRREGERA